MERGLEETQKGKGMFRSPQQREGGEGDEVRGMDEWAKPGKPPDISPLGPGASLGRGGARTFS